MTDGSTELKQRHRSPTAPPLADRPCTAGHVGAWKPTASGSYICAPCMLESGRRSRNRKANTVEALIKKRDKLTQELAEVIVQLALKESKLS